MKHFLIQQNTPKNRNWNFTVVLYFTWKLEFASNFLSMIVVLRAVWLKKIKVRNYSLPHFPRWLMGNLLYLSDVWKGRSYVNANVSVSTIFENSQFYLKYQLLRHWRFLLEEIQLSVNRYVSVPNFFSQITKSTAVLCIDRNVPRFS